MITEDYVSFETAKLLKEKGFDEETRGYYPIKGDATGRLMFGSEYNHNHSQVQISAPTLQIAMKWLREMYNLHILSVPYPHEDGVFYWAYEIDFLDSDTLAVMVTKIAAGFDTYEQACEAAIKYCLTELFN